VDASVNLLHKVARSTLTVASKIHPDHPSVPVLGSNRFGTGCCVDDRGHVLTVNYILLGASEVSVVDIEGREHAAELVAQDFATGVGLLRIATRSVPALEPGDSHAARLGQDVCLVASAGGADRRSACAVVSSFDEFDAYWEYKLERAVWLSAANPGLGGGPVCDSMGRVLGVVSLNLGAIGRATLAIPAECYFKHSRELAEHGRRVSRPPRAWLGMFCYAVDDRTVIAGLVPGSPGEKWGLESGDVIVRIDGEHVTARSELYERIWTHGPGDVVDLDVYRDGRIVNVPVQSVDVETFFAS